MEDSEIRATVHGTYPYETMLNWDGYDFEAYCSCPAFDRAISSKK